MSDVKYIKTPSGLPLIFVKREGFQQKYVGIGTTFGGSNLEFNFNGKYYKTKTGLAHFFEHKAFIMPTGKDCLELFENLNAESNASTSAEQTVYYFTTNDDIEKPLRLLIDMYFTKGYTKENIESEKDIILAEYDDAFDIPEIRIENKCNSLLYPNDAYSIDALGFKEDILATTIEDLDLIFESFYHPTNSLLVVVGDIEEKYLYDIVTSELNKFSFKDIKIERLKTYNSLMPSNPETIYEDIPYPELHVLGRIDSLDNKTSILTSILIVLFNNLFSVEAPFYKKVVDMGLLLTEDIQNIVITHEFGTMFHLNAVSLNPGLLAELMVEAIKNFSIDDVNLELTFSSIKCHICDHIRAKDSISFIGEETLSVGLEGDSYDGEVELLKNLTKEDLIKYVPYIKESLLTYLIVLPKNVEK